MPSREPVSTNSTRAPPILNSVVVAVERLAIWHEGLGAAKRRHGCGFALTNLHLSGVVVLDVG